MNATLEHKELLRKVLSCFKKAGVDISTVSKIKSDTVHSEFSIKAKGKEFTVGIEFSSGDVYYEYFTSRDKIGNVSDLNKLTAIIKDGTQENEIEPNVDEDVIKRLKEVVKKFIGHELAEESATGSGASFSHGQGEQYATPNAFKKKQLKEDVTYTKDKVKDLLSKAKSDLSKYQSSAKILYGKFSGVSLGDLLEESGINEFKRIGDASEKFYKKVENEGYTLSDMSSNMYDEYSDNNDNEAYNLYKQINELEDQYKNLEYGLEVIQDLSEVIISKIEHMTEYGKLKHLKDFQQGIK